MDGGHEPDDELHRSAQREGGPVSGLQVVVAYAAPGVEAIVTVDLPPGATVADAVAASGIVARHGLDAQPLGYAIFGARVEATTPLVAGDRVELTRPLLADPKETRRRRAAVAPRPGRRDPPG
jgi:putative ubiquitin-RnfH superfamily antitoxin RatB of RatAB toxin-antitoxin module